MDRIHLSRWGKLSYPHVFVRLRSHGLTFGTEIHYVAHNQRLPRHGKFYFTILQ